MNQAQAARQTPEEEPAANVKPEEPQRAQILARVRRRIREQPLTAASGAFILGFAIGNGVPKFLARAGIAVGLRLVMQRMFDRSELLDQEV